MSCDGPTIGAPLAGEKMLLVVIISTWASACASTHSGKMHGHLVTVEVRVETLADQRMQHDGVAFDQHRLKRLNTHSVQRRCTVQQHRMLMNDLFENVPDLLVAPLNHALGALDRVG